MVKNKNAICSNAVAEIGKFFCRIGACKILEEKQFLIKKNTIIA